MSKEFTAHWRGIVKIGLIAITVVATSACVAATAGICGSLAFTVASFEVSGGSMLIGAGVGAASGAVQYAIDPGRHDLSGYLKHALGGAAIDSLMMGAPEELVFGNLGKGIHAAQWKFLQAVKELPGYLKSAL